MIDGVLTVIAAITQSWIGYIVLLFVLLPFVYGCQGGGGGSHGGPAAGFNGPTSSFISDGGSSGGGEGGSGGDSIAQIHNPEPATMLLMGSGLMAIGFRRTRRKK